MAGGVDHCTAFFEGWWAACCAAHDNDYAEQIGRLLADDRLWSCVMHSADGTTIAAIASGFIAALMYVFVRLFGGRFYRPR